MCYGKLDFARLTHLFEADFTGNTFWTKCLRLAGWYMWPKKADKKVFIWLFSKVILGSGDIVKQEWNHVFLMSVYLYLATPRWRAKVSYLNLYRERKCFMQGISSLWLLKVWGLTLLLHIFLIWFQQNLMVALVIPNMCSWEVLHIVYLKMISLAKSRKR